MVPFQVVGDKEVESGQVDLRVCGQDQCSAAVDVFVKRVEELLENEGAGA